MSADDPLDAVFGPDDGADPPRVPQRAGGTQRWCPPRDEATDVKRLADVYRPIEKRRLPWWRRIF